MDLFLALGLIVLCIIAFAHERCRADFAIENKYIANLIPVAVCFVIAFIFSIYLDLCPFNIEAPKTDSSVFLYIGRAMYNGSVPYLDLFDHKGPMLYFIQLFGYVIGFGSFVGVWVVELLNIFATAYIFYKIARLVTDNDFVSYFAVATVLLFCSHGFFEGGNLVEEYALPWIALSLYIVCKFFTENSYKSWHIALIGAAMSVVFFLRVNMIGIWVGLILPVVICFIKDKRYKELYRAILLFLGGFFAVAIPIIIYLLCTQSFGAMIDYYFVFNFSYVDSSSKAGIITFLFDCVLLAPIATLGIVYSVFAHSKSALLRVNLVSLAFAYISASISGRAFKHYGIVLIPFFVIPLTLFVCDFLKKAKNVKVSTLKKSVLVFICVLSISLVISDTEVSLEKFTPDDGVDEVVEYITDVSSEDDDVLVIGNDVSYYFKFNRGTENKFFYQTPPIEVSDEIYEQFIEEMKEHPSDFIVTRKQKHTEEEPSAEALIINGLWHEYDTTGLYDLKELDDYYIFVRTER